MALVLIGFMGAGKSTLAGRLAALRGRAPIDGDTLLVERFGHSVAREFELHGEQAFRAAEEEVVCGLLESVDARDVIALGGGSVLSARVRAALTGHIDRADSRSRRRSRGSAYTAMAALERPLARDRDAFEASVRAAARDVRRGRRRRYLLWAESASGQYPVLVGRGLLDGERDGPPRLAARPLRLAPLLRDRRDRRRALRASGSGSWAALVSDPARRATQDARERRAGVG